MRRRSGRILIGTSGWVYPDWVGPVYPQRLKSQEAFAYYAKHFGTVELNSTFYHFPRQTTIEHWKAMGGDRFVWSVKCWRWVTHVKRLRGVTGDVRDFLERVEPLTRGGVLLVQLPPSARQDLKRLERFLRRLPSSLRTALEFRHNSWFANDTYALLRRFGVALVGVDAPGIQRVLDVRTASFAYFRLHGSSRWYEHDYSRRELRVFAQAAKAHRTQGDVHVYFDPSTRAPAMAGGPSLGMSPAMCRGVVPSEVEGRRSGAPGLPGGLHNTAHGYAFHNARWLQRDMRCV